MSNSNITQRGTQDSDSDPLLIANIGDSIIILQMFAVLFSGTQIVI